MRSATRQNSASQSLSQTAPLMWHLCGQPARFLGAREVHVGGRASRIVGIEDCLYRPLGILVGSPHQFFTSRKAELELIGARSLELELAFRQYAPSEEHKRMPEQ